MIKNVENDKQLEEQIKIKLQQNNMNISETRSIIEQIKSELKLNK